VNFLDCRQAQGALTNAAWWRLDVNLTDAQGEPSRVNAIEV
jgi:hypothetical protein